MELTADRITRQYKNKIAVDRMSFTLTKGVTGLLGANGAGKTTLMRILCGILVPDSGTVTCDGMGVETEEYRDMLGYLPQEFGYYPEFSGRDFLLYMSAVKGLQKTAALKKIAELIELTGLKDAARKKVCTYSGGMKQRLGIAQALLNDPQILIMDEPTAGLDPQERIRFRKGLIAVDASVPALFENDGHIDIVEHGMSQSPLSVTMYALGAASASRALLTSDFESDDGIDSMRCSYNSNIFKVRRF